MSNLTNPRIIWFKGILFMLMGLLATGILVSQFSDWQHVILLLIAIWSFCRAYYFAFYVIEHYVDPSYRFAGLIDFFRYAIGGVSPDRAGRDQRL